MAKHNIRHATKADFEGVMSIGDVYHGNDYLPHFYHSFIEDPNARSYVYFVGDEVVAFSSDVLVDDGHTLLLRAGRVRDDYRDQGIYGQLLKHVYKEYSQMEGVDFEAMTTNNIIYEAKKGRLPQQFTEEWWKTLENVMCNSSNIDVPTVLASSTKVLTEEDIVSIFSREGTREDLFPCGRLVVDWCSYKPLASNMKYILKSGGLALATKDSAEKTLLLSISTFFPCQLGFNYLVDVFGTDNLHLKDHVITHLKHMKSLTDGQVLFQVATDRNEAKTKEILMNLKLQPYDFPDNTIHYLGRKFQKR